MLKNLTPPALMIFLLASSVSGCTPVRESSSLEPDSDPLAGADLSTMPPPRSPADLALPNPAYICGQYSNYKARVDGVARSPCDYDVSKILSVGGNVKTKITPPLITMEFPDGTFFKGTTDTDGKTFNVTRTTDFMYKDHCQWHAVETMAGTIDAGNNCTLNATYTYREAPTSPPPCDIPCTIDANVIIERVGIIIG